MIQAETYLLACQRYIELNPVRAAMVDDPAHYRWTSYRHNALGQASPYLTPHPLYLAIGRGDTERQAAYRDLFRAQLDNKAIDDIRLALNQNQPLGSSRVDGLPSIRDGGLVLFGYRSSSLRCVASLHAQKR